MNSNSSCLKDFEILNKLGTGSFGTVFKVRKKLNNNFYVLKQINISNMNKIQKNDALNEVVMLKSIESPFIVKYYDSFVENNILNIIMEFCEKGDLSQLLKRQGGKLLPEGTIWKYFIELSNALEHLHSMKILHRDIKTMNIFLTKDDHIRLGDLGVAKVLANTNNFAHTIVGTPYYLSPELCQEKPYNHKTDIWSLGCVLYEVATLKHPFDSNNQGALVLKIIQGRYEKLPSGYSHDLQEIVDLCLCKDYKKRPSIFELLSHHKIQSTAASQGMKVNSVEELMNKIKMKKKNKEKKETKESKEIKKPDKIPQPDVKKKQNIKIKIEAKKVVLEPRQQPENKQMGLPKLEKKISENIQKPPTNNEDKRSPTENQNIIKDKQNLITPKDQHANQAIIFINPLNPLLEKNSKEDIPIPKSKGIKNKKRKINSKLNKKSSEKLIQPNINPLKPKHCQSKQKLDPGDASQDIEISRNEVLNLPEIGKTKPKEIEDKFVFKKPSVDEILFQSKSPGKKEPQITQTIIETDKMIQESLGSIMMKNIKEEKPINNNFVESININDFLLEENKYEDDFEPIEEQKDEVKSSPKKVEIKKSPLKNESSPNKNVQKDNDISKDIEFKIEVENDITSHKLNNWKAENNENSDEDYEDNNDQNFKLSPDSNHSEHEHNLEVKDFNNNDQLEYSIESTNNNSTLKIDLVDEKSCSDIEKKERELKKLELACSEFEELYKRQIKTCIESGVNPKVIENLINAMKNLSPNEEADKTVMQFISWKEGEDNFDYNVYKLTIQFSMFLNKCNEKVQLAKKLLTIKMNSLNDQI